MDNQRDDDFVPPTTEEALDVLIPNACRLRLFLAIQYNMFGKANELFNIMFSEVVFRDADDMMTVLMNWLPYYGDPAKDRWANRMGELFRLKKNAEINAWLKRIPDVRMQALMRMAVNIYAITLIQERVQDGAALHLYMNNNIRMKMDASLYCFLTNWGLRDHQWGFEYNMGERFTFDADPNEGFNTKEDETPDPIEATGD